MPTVLHRLDQWAEASPNSIAQRYKDPGGADWKDISVREYRDRVHHLALFLESRGMGPGACGAILSYNRPEWVHADLAVQLLGARSAGLYPNSNARDIDYVLKHSEATVLAVQNAEYFKKIERVPDGLSLVLVFDGDTSLHPKAVAYSAAIEEGARLARAKGARTFKSYLDKLDPNAGAFLIYTSGTTGNPKGALLSHDNLAFTADLAKRTWKLPMGRGSMFSFLPLCHIAEKLQSIGVGLTCRYTVSFCTKFENVAKELPEVQPTLLLCVPRLWEKMMDGVMLKVRGGKGVKKALATWALATGARVADARYSGRSPGLADLVQLRLAEKLVLSKVKQALGLARAEILASGAAALGAHISRWFRSLGLEILEDFGQTESTGVICMTLPGVECAGTVGRPVEGIEFRLADDGEVLTRGRHVFKGYFKDPEGTAAALDKDGWLRTGDLGEWSPEKLLRIRGRKKEILKTSGGKMVAPLPIEERLKAAPVISQVCMVGDGRKYLSALITLTEDKLAEVKTRLGRSELDTVVADRDVVGEVQGAVDAVNADLASFEQIKRFAVLGREFSVIDGEMTPTLKMKRNVIETRFREVIDGMYS